MKSEGREGGRQAGKTHVHVHTTTKYFDNQSATYNMYIPQFVPQNKAKQLAILAGNRSTSYAP